MAVSFNSSLTSIHVSEGRTNPGAVEHGLLEPTCTWSPIVVAQVKFLAGSLL
ncbi:hypothetical protein [Spirosoma aerolatum]|uniref:hypothetical protein n=1 Tax=Spirosoma aerolatum TaxID=1211326 RepID=UPI0012D2F455|nr:hypothetical protein [Spirosoma aerolatum]